MKKIIVVLLILVSGIISCELEYGQAIGIGNIYDYDFENDIPKIDSIDDALLYVKCNMEYSPDNKDYWQTPEETYWRINENGKMLGDCEDYSLFLGYILYSKLEFDISLIRVSDSIEGFHILLLWNNKYIEPQTGAVYPNTKFSSNQIKWILSYTEALWMAINYHDSIGKYE